MMGSKIRKYYIHISKLMVIMTKLQNYKIELAFLEIIKFSTEKLSI